MKHSENCGNRNENEAACNKISTNKTVCIECMSPTGFDQQNRQREVVNVEADKIQVGETYYIFITKWTYMGYVSYPKAAKVLGITPSNDIYSYATIEVEGEKLDWPTNGFYANLDDATYASDKYDSEIFNSEDFE